MSTVSIAIATSPQGVSVANEVRLIKPAVLYGDRVRLYSPVASLLQGVAGLGEASESELLFFLEEIADAFDPSLRIAVQRYRELQRKRNPSRDELVAMMRMREGLKESRREFQNVAEGVLRDAGALQLVPAIQAGLVEIYPLALSDEDMVDAFVAELKQLLAEGSAYPLFDDQTGELVRAGIAEGLFVPSEVAMRRGKHVATASGFLSQLPAFPEATIGEILDIRADLAKPLIRYRSGVSELATMIESGPLDKDFSQEIEIVYVEKVLPALLEITELVRSTSFLRELASEVVKDANKLAGVLALGILNAETVPALTAAGATGVAIAARTAWRRHQASADIQKHQLYFLYKTEKLLQPAKVSLIGQ